MFLVKQAKKILGSDLSPLSDILEIPLLTPMMWRKHNGFCKKVPLLDQERLGKCHIWRVTLSVLRQYEFDHSSTRGGVTGWTLGILHGPFLLLFLAQFNALMAEVKNTHLQVVDGEGLFPIMFNPTFSDFFFLDSILVSLCSELFCRLCTYSLRFWEKRSFIFITTIIINDIYYYYHYHYVTQNNNSQKRKKKKKKGYKWDQEA